MLVLLLSLRCLVEVGRKPKADLARADTPHIVSAMSTICAGIQIVVIVAQIVLIAIIESSGRPPIAVCGAIKSTATIPSTSNG